MRILFTGHRGFLGRELIPILCESFEVLEYQGDLTNWLDFAKFIESNQIERIIHAAVRGGRRNKIETPETLVNNLQTFFNVIKTQIPTISFCSGAIYDRRRSLNSIAENASGESIPIDYYGQSKFIINKIATSESTVSTLRFFNVFGVSEGIDRFITFNISQYINRKPMVIYNDFYMDFFFVKDLSPVLRAWLDGQNLPKEMNLVYMHKYLLSEICGIINELSSHKVPVIQEGMPSENNYTGDGSLFSGLFPSALGLERGIYEMYKEIQG
jgi:nucleoside-diphosphate-sugar epimerase